MYKYLLLLTFLITGCGYEVEIKKADEKKEEDNNNNNIPSFPIPPSSSPKPTIPSSPTNSSDQFFSTYIKQLNQMLSKVLQKDYQIKTSIKMVEKFDSPSVLGRCIRFNQKQFDSRNSIEISKEMLDKIPPEIKEKWLLLILAHEVGHCDFILDHSFQGVVTDNAPKELFSGANQRRGEKIKLLRQSLMWPSLSVQETDLLFSMLETYLSEMIDPNFVHKGTLEKFEWQPTNLPIIQFASRFYVFDQANNKILETFDQGEFYSALNIFSLMPIDQDLASSLPDYNCQSN